MQGDLMYFLHNYIIWQLLSLYTLKIQIINTK